MWVQDQFQHAFNNQFETYGPEALAKAWVSKDGWFEAVAENYAALHKSTLLLWGEDDITYGENALDRMLKLIPHAASVKLPKVGNYVPEEAPDAGITHIRRFIS